MRRDGHEVGLLAPQTPASTLVGAGPGEAAQLLSWERADVASLLSREPSPPLREELARYDWAIAYTRAAPLLDGLRAVLPRVVAQDPEPPAGAGHASCWLAAAVGSAGGPEPPVLAATAAEVERSRSLRERLPAGFLALHPGSGSPAKNWPPERFAALAEALSPGRPWLLILGPADAVAGRRLAAAPGALLATDLPLRALGGLLAQAGLYVGNDSGVSHLAAAFGAPTLALFGPTDSRTWAPVGPTVRIVQAPAGRMERLETKPVVAAARAML